MKNIKNTTLEVIAPTVEEAIERGLTELGLERENVEVEILDEGSKGIFGLGTRQARIRLIIKETIISPQASAEEIAPNTSLNKATENEFIQAPTQSRQDYGEIDSEILSVAKETVEELLENMKVKASVQAQFAEKDAKTGIQPILINIIGDDLSILIGKNAETLNALQFITRQIVNKELGRSIHLIVDVEGYRMRREKQLIKIAERIAEQVIETGKSLSLEPMPPNERRIVHLALRDNPSVFTESTGEGHHRKVVVYPKK